MAYRFGDFEVDFGVYELRKASEPVRVDRKVFDLLRYLIEHRERVVDKHELLKEVWGGEVVVDAVVTTAVARLRKVLGQRGGEGGPVQTVHGRGYRFIEPLVAHVPSAAAKVASAAATSYVDTDLHPGLRDPFVGREEPMQRLSGALTKALAGTVRARLIAGEPGMGKTRLCQEIAARARDAGARTWMGRCYEADRSEPLWPWVQILRQAVDAEAIEALRSLPPQQLAELTALVPELGSSRTAHVEPKTAVPGLPLFEAMTRFFRAACQRAPLVLILDDVHWADAPSLTLLGYLLDEIGGGKLLVLATFRDVELEPGHPLAAQLDRLERAPSFKRISVAALTAPDVMRYVGEMTGQAPSEDLVKRLHELTAGNPFFLRETVRSLTWESLSAGHLRLGDIRLPESARDVVRRRIGLLPEATRTVLQAASVVGLRFDVNTLGPMVELDTASLLAALDRAVAARLLVREDGVGHHGFVHALVRDTIHDDLSTSAKCELHLLAGRALEQQRALRPATTVEIAFHLHSALPHGDGNRVCEYGVRAAQQAAALGDHEQEALWYARAYEGLSFDQAPDIARSAELMLALGRAHRASGRPDAARAALGRVLELGAAGGAAEHWVDAAKQELARLGSAS